MVALSPDPIHPSPITSLQDYLDHPLPHTEWVNGTLLEKTGMTLLHSKVQADLAFRWKLYLQTQGQSGEVYTEALCQTLKQGRRPDVAYLTPDLVALYGHHRSLPQSFPLIAEIVSPDDEAEALLAKVQEYLDSGSAEVWLVYPEAREVMIRTPTQRIWLGEPAVVKTQVILTGFEVSIWDLFT